MGNIGIIRFILSLKRGRDFLAATLFVIVVEGMVIVYLFKETNELNRENKEVVISSQQRLIDFLTKQNEEYSEMKRQIDSAKNALEIFKIKKEMK